VNRPDDYHTWSRERQNAWYAEITEAPRRPAVKRNGSNGEENPIRFSATDFREAMLDSSALYRVKGLLPSAGLVLIWGEPKCGKSFWTHDLLMHVALDWEYRGHRVKPGPVVYCILEGQQGFRRRNKAFLLEKMANNDANPPFFLMETPISLARDHKHFIADIRRQIGAPGPAVICLDTLNRSIDGSESDDRDMAAYIRAADAIHKAFNCLVVIIHHCGHEAKRPRGHSSLMGALDVQISIKRDTEGNIVAEVELGKDVETGLQFVSRLKTVEIGVDEDGDPITSCVIVEAAASTKPPPEPKRSEADILRHAYLDAYDRLADAVPTTHGYNGKSVRKVPAVAIHTELKDSGFLEIEGVSTDGNSRLTRRCQSQLSKARTELLGKKTLIERKGLIWRPN